MTIKKYNLLVLLTVSLFITLGAIGYLGYSLWSVGGPYNVDSSGCGSDYVSTPAGRDTPIRVCQNEVLVPIAEFLVMAGLLTSIIAILLMLLPSKESNLEKLNVR